MKIPEKYSVKSISFDECKEWIIKKHYARRVPPIEYSFGLFDNDSIICGIITFGTPVSNALRNLWNGEYKLIELNRLVVNEGLPKNSLSFFLSTAMKMIKKTYVIVSYADTSQNHHGYIYQATNWTYTGLSLKFKDYYIKGKEHMHNGTIMDMSRGRENRVKWLREKFGDDLITIERPRKHRYFYFLGSKNEKADMISKLPYSIEKYPKGDNIRYNCNHIITPQLNLF